MYVVVIVCSFRSMSLYFTALFLKCYVHTVRAVSDTQALIDNNTVVICDMMRSRITGRQHAVYN